MKTRWVDCWRQGQKLGLLWLYWRERIIQRNLPYGTVTVNQSVIDVITVPDYVHGSSKSLWNCIRPVNAVLGQGSVLVTRFRCFDEVNKFTTCYVKY